GEVDRRAHRRLEADEEPPLVLRRDELGGKAGEDEERRPEEREGDPRDGPPPPDCRPQRAGVTGRELLEERVDRTPEPRRPLRHVEELGAPGGRDRQRLDEREEDRDGEDDAELE